VVVKTKIGVYRVLMGAEIDCCDRESPGEAHQWGATPAAAGAPGRRLFVELKCSAEPDNPEKLLRFERDKLLRDIQSFLAGVPTVVCAFRDRHGRVTRVSRWTTEDLKAPARKAALGGGTHAGETPRWCLWLYGTVEDGRLRAAVLAPVLADGAARNVLVPGCHSGACRASAGHGVTGR